MPDGEEFINYQVKNGESTVDGDITRRQLQQVSARHQARWPSAEVVQVGSKVSEEEARAWARARGFNHTL